jgi:hypothetical protein
MRVATFNMLGGGGWYDVGLLFTNHSVDIALLQECGQLPRSELVADRGDVKIYSWGGRTVYHMEYGSGNSRCSTAVVLGPQINAASWKHFDPDQDHSDRRRLLCVQVAETWYCSIHAPGFGGPGSLEYAKYMLGKCNTDFQYFVCGGDYNNEPSQIPHISNKIHVAPPSSATHRGGGKIDYLVTKNVVYQCEKVTLGGSDHGWTIFKA